MADGLIGHFVRAVHEVRVHEARVPAAMASEHMSYAMTPGNGDDLALLRRYARENSAEAFATLVGRYADFVFATALRQTRCRDLAEDVTQAAFIVLARRAPSLRDGTSVAGFLHQTAVYAAKNALRGEQRRRRHEAQAARPAGVTHADPPQEPPAAAAIDRALLRVRDPDRQLLLLHYFDGFTIAEAAAKLSISHEAARKRLHRALARLRALLEGDGVSLADAALPAAVAALAKTSAGVKAATLVASTAVGGGADGIAFSLAHEVLRAMKITTGMKVAAAAAAVLVVGATTTVVVRQVLGPRRPQRVSIPASNATLPAATPQRVLITGSYTGSYTGRTVQAVQAERAAKTVLDAQAAAANEIIDYAKVFSRSRHGMDVRAQLARTMRESEQQFAQRTDEIARLKKTRDAQTAGSAEYRRLDAQLAAAVARHDQINKTQQAEILRTQMEAMMTLFHEMEEAITAVAAAEHVTLPPATNLPPWPQTASPATVDQIRQALNARRIKKLPGAPDLTEKVLARLDSQYHPAPATAPAGTRP
jgi:RNA polymerase sigma factor (sigma-70 family)